jgi:methylmalonyl-CoA mutase, N-terminal domain
LVKEGNLVTSKVDEIKNKQIEWTDKINAKVQAKNLERKKEFLTDSSITTERIYTPADLEATDYLQDLGMPGEYPFTRGVQPTMYRGRLWTS